MGLHGLLLVCLVLVGCTPIRSRADPPATSVASPPSMRVVINADGTASLVPEDAAANPLTPPGVVLPFTPEGGLVPLWQIEQDRLARAQEEKERQRRYEQDQADKRKQKEKEEEEAAAAAAAAAAQAAREQEDQQRDAAERESAEARQAESGASPSDAGAEELDDEVAELMRGRPQQQQPEQQSDSMREEHQRQQEASQQQQQQEEQQAAAAAQRAAEESQERQRAADEIAAAAARAYAEAGLVKVSEETNQVSTVDPGQSLFDYLQRSQFFNELHQHNAWHYVTQNRPFVILILCRCHRDSNLDINGLENLLVDAGLHHKFTFLFAQNPIVTQFQMANTYGLQEGHPAFVIDNIPIGQHVEKYVYQAKSIEYPHTAQAADLFHFLSDFLRAPTPLQLVLRSRPNPNEQFQLDHDRGKVVDVVGSTFASIVLESPYTVLLMLHSPGCGGCQAALPVLTQVAESLAWTNREVLVVKMDRTANDVPVVLRFSSYPAIFLYQAGMKVYDTSAAGGEEPMNRGAVGSRGYRAPIDYYGPLENPRQGDLCNAPLNAADVLAWVAKHTGGGRLLGGGGPTTGQQSLPGEQSTHPADPADQQHREAQSTQQAGAAM